MTIRTRRNLRRSEARRDLWRVAMTDRTPFAPSFLPSSRRFQISGARRSKLRGRALILRARSRDRVGLEDGTVDGGQPAPKALPDQTVDAAAWWRDEARRDRSRSVRDRGFRRSVLSQTMRENAVWRSAKPCDSRSHDSFSAIDDLILQAEQAAAAKPNQVRLVAELVRLVGDRGADPYLLIGVLVRWIRSPSTSRRSVRRNQRNS
jgi:hypothetical protein